MGHRYIEIVEGDPEGRWPPVDLPDDDTYLEAAMQVIEGWFAQDADGTMKCCIHQGIFADDGTEMNQTGTLDSFRALNYLRLIP